jgi:hypothetical protein
MTARILTVLCLALAVSRAIAQTGPSAGEMPPDQQAYTEANKIADPEKKIAALGKLKTDFPDGVYASLADSQILSTLILKMPEQKGAFVRQPAMFAAAAARDKAVSRKHVRHHGQSGQHRHTHCRPIAAADLLLKTPKATPGKVRRATYGSLSVGRHTP